MSQILSRLDQPAVRFIAVFFLLVIGLNFLIGLAWVDRNAVLPYTEGITALSASALELMGYQIDQQGTIMRSSNFAVDIRRGCDGVVATILLISACLAYPAAWRQRLLGTVMGYGLIFLLNLIRILVLFALGEGGAMDLFSFVHTYVAQFAVIALTMVFWISWAARQRPLYQ